MKKFLPWFFVILIAAVIVAAGCFIINKQRISKNRACTMEAKICPNGSSVGRTGANCEFAECPNAASTGMANPASVNCINQGGNLAIKDGPNGQYGLCYFDDNRACEEWAMMRGDCPVGGVKTTGYDTEAQRFCAWSGGSTLAVPNAVCKFSDGSQCDADAFYNGACQKGEQPAG